MFKLASVVPIGPAGCADLSVLMVTGAFVAGPAAEICSPPAGTAVLSGLLLQITFM